MGELRSSVIVQLIPTHMKCKRKIKIAIKTIVDKIIKIEQSPRI